MRGPDLLKLSRVLGRLFMRLSGLSWRVRYVRAYSGRTGSARGIPVFFAFWHGRQLPLIHTHRGEGITVLVSRNRDGQYVTNVLHSMGFATVRGSSSRGGMEAVRRMAQILVSGTDCAITPDGPRGPAEEAKAGTAHISRLGKRPVIPMGTASWPSLRFRSWDRFMLPLPFSRIVVVEGRPLRYMERGRDPEKWSGMLEAGLQNVTAYADLLASPRAVMTARALSTAAGALLPLASVALLLRSGPERTERKGITKRRRGAPVWLHGSSLGELNGLLPYIEKLREKGLPVHVTCFTPSGREFIRDRELTGSYIPLDIPCYVNRFLDSVAPRALILAETELWPNTLMETLARRIPCILVNGRLSDRSLRRYRPFSHLAGGMLSCFHAVGARSGEDMEKFASLGVSRKVLRLSGDSKFLADSGDPPKHWRELFSTERPVLVAGSTRKGEEDILMSAASSAGYFPVMVPRHLDRVEELESLMYRRGHRPARWSSLTGDTAASLDFDSVVVDVHGVLARMYGAADVAFVGGTLVPVGGHNILEPVMRGVPVIVGPNHQSFREAVERLGRTGTARVFSTEVELTRILDDLRACPPSREDVLGEFRKMRGSLLDGMFEMFETAGILEDRGTT